MHPSAYPLNPTINFFFIIHLHILLDEIFDQTVWIYTICPLNQVISHAVIHEITVAYYKIFKLLAVYFIAHFCMVFVHISYGPIIVLSFPPNISQSKYVFSQSIHSSIHPLITPSNHPSIDPSIHQSIHPNLLSHLQSNVYPLI